MKKHALFLLILLVLSTCSPYVSTPAAVAPTVTAQATIAPTRTPAPTATPLTAEVTAAESLHVRSKPFGVVIGYVYHADVIQLSGKCRDGWAQIAWQSGKAWVRAKFLSDNKCQ